MTRSLEEVAEIKRKEKELYQAKIERDYRKLDDQKKLEAQLDSLSLDSLEAQAQDPNFHRSIVQKIESSAKAIRNSLPFVSDKMTKLVPQIPGQITLIGAESGTGKSSVTAAIAHRNYKFEKKTLVISNEEPAQRVLARIACIEEGVSFNDYSQDLVSRDERKRVAQRIGDVKDFVTVVDNELVSTTAERIVDFLRSADAKGYTMAVIDFLQRVTRSTAYPGAERTQVVYAFKDLITDFSSTAQMPVVVMSQLKPLDPDEQDRAIELRIKWCTGFYEACSNVVEAIRIKDIPVTVFHTQKGRFTGSKRLWLPHEFVEGKFVPIDKARLAHIKQENKDRIVNEKLEDLTAGLEPADA